MASFYKQIALYGNYYLFVLFKRTFAAEFTRMPLVHQLFPGIFKAIFLIRLISWLKIAEYNDQDFCMQPK